MRNQVCAFAAPGGDSSAKLGCGTTDLEGRYSLSVPMYSTLVFKYTYKEKTTHNFEMVGFEKTTRVSVGMEHIQVDHVDATTATLRVEFFGTGRCLMYFQFVLCWEEIIIRLSSQTKIISSIVLSEDVHTVTNKYIVTGPSHSRFFIYNPGEWFSKK
jgi:hypothetical protein